MTGMEKMQEKKLEDGAVVTIWRDPGHHGYYAGKVPDDKHAKHPMGAFLSLDAARAWAEHEWPGGAWQ
jgi:hypothetical protein